MATVEIVITDIKKLSHPIKEIRQRALQLLAAKLQLGWDFDELSGTRQLFETLLSWFEVQQPTLQREALELLLTTVKTKSGTYIAKEYGIKRLLSILSSIKHKVDDDALETFNDVVEILRFFNTVESKDDVTVPRLKLLSVTSSESDGGSSSGFYNLGPNFQSSKETSISNRELGINRCNVTKPTDGTKVLLFPWVELCSSDSKTMLLIEDALKLLKSTRRCCRFIRDVFLRDFPAEIFLNRPAIIQNLLAIANSHEGRPGEALHVLLCITRALSCRLSQLTSIDLIHHTNKISDEQSMDNGVSLELEQMIGGHISPHNLLEEDSLAALNQLPVPIYALDTTLAVLTIMVRSVVLVDPVDICEVLDLKELNVCIRLVESLIQLLLQCVSESFWSMDHTSKTLRDIAHKSCMVMRMLGDLLMKYRKSYSEDSSRIHHRVIWLRLVSYAVKLFNWARQSALPPSSLVVALQNAQLDPSLELFYPEICKSIAVDLQCTKIQVDQEFKSKYRELTKLCGCMDDAVKFMKNKNNCRNSKDVLTCIQNSLPVLELHQSETYLTDVANVLLKKTKDFDFIDSDWSKARSVALYLMAHNIDWVAVKFYKMMADMVKNVLVSDDVNQSDNEKCLTLLCDVSILTEICCHGLSSQIKEVETSASEIVIYLLRGRLILSESCWWRLLASLLPVLPLLHVYAAHDTPLGQAVCKSLEADIAECMGVPAADARAGLSRLMFVHCPSVQLDAAHSLCRLLDDERYLPPRESLRADILLNALKRIQPQDFNVDSSSSPSKVPQTTGLLQILDVLKQDIILDEHGTELVTRSSIRPTLEPSFRRSTLQQLSVMMRHLELHDTFLQSDGLRVIVVILRMSLMVDDYLAFPECAISCVSVLNSLCFTSRYSLAKISDLPALLIRVILVFPANDSAVVMSAQVLAVVVWAGFILQELDTSRHRVPALPMAVTERTSLPFLANSYWASSPNAEHSSIEWLISDEEWRCALRVRWWCAWEGVSRLTREAPYPPAPLSLRPEPRDSASLQAACVLYSCTRALLALENATSHRQVIDALHILESYVHLVRSSSVDVREFAALPWQHMRRFLCAPPASPRDAALLIALLQFVQAYMDNVPPEGNITNWIKSCFIDNDATIISLLSREELYPHQTSQESIEITQLHINIVKVLLRCIITLDYYDNCDSRKMESLLKILLACLERVDLKNFHMLGFLNELMRCIRYLVNSQYCKLSEDTLIHCLKLMTITLSGCASGGGRKGQACRLDALLSLLALLRQIYEESIPVQRWSDAWVGDAMRAVCACTRASACEIRAAALQVCAALAHYAQLLPHLHQALPEESLSQFAASVFAQCREANIVRAGAAALLAAITTRASPQSDILELQVLEQLNENNFLENCLDILVDFCNDQEYINNLQPNLPLSMLERRTELEVRARKCGDVRVSPSLVMFRGRAPPTAALVTAVADLLFNTSCFSRCPVAVWNDQGLYRLLFKCASRCSESRADAHNVRAAACRALVAASTHKGVRTTLAATNDCLHNLLATLTPLDEDDYDAAIMSSRAQVLLLLASLLPEQSASDAVWKELMDGRAMSFFHLLLQCLECDENELQDAGFHCFTQLSQSTLHMKHPDKTKDNSYVELFDNLKSPFVNDLRSGRRGDECQTEYMAEEFCKVLMRLYQEMSDHKKYQASQDERWIRLCSCLSSILATSCRSRLYAVHRQFPRVSLASLQAVRDHLSLQGKPVDVIRNADNNPALCTLYWILTIITSVMVECPSSKESYAEDNIVASLNRLWPWCMMSDQLRDAVMHLLLTFTNDCPKAWAGMSTCVGGRNLVGETCSLVCREAARVSRTRSDARLALALRTLRYCAKHHHCRALILKSEALSCIYKLRVNERGSSAAAVQWAKLCETVSRFADGASAVLALRPLLVSRSLRAQLMPALAHAAHYHRATFLQSSDLLELLAATLLAGDTCEVVSAARAVWALAANNHKAKLLLRSAGVSSAVQGALERLQRHCPDTGSQRALQLLTYTHNVVHAT